MTWGTIGGLATVASAILGWVSFGHLAALLGVEILASLWFARLRTRESRGPVTNPHAKEQAHTVKVGGQEVERVFRPVQGEPLSTEDRHWLADNNAIVLGGGGAMAIFAGVMADPSFFTGVQLLVLAALATQMVVAEHRRHTSWVSAGHGATADPTVQMNHEYWRLLVFVGFMFAMALFFGAPRFLAVAFAVTLLLTDQALEGKREQWSGEAAPTA
ncbi:hypothetical protein [Nocardioides jishulii]|uniref:Uncharacterized protein n=1 Tax=Nocardioides jishulii TaxID=2575440 RepID=A0A4U2YSM7_9ACTN|nr:hypothetical protein [Nocardioides jishulii]QCX26213.1 hypothetical protein FCL41_00660 [Nocardioides jishulii]TKI63984.1 hypothetical protein FC770_02045 [Nocardioides jishulii]